MSTKLDEDLWTEDQIRAVVGPLEAERDEARFDTARAESELSDCQDRWSRDVARLRAERDRIALKVRCLEARETFCSDCFDKVARQGCWRCKAQALRARADRLAEAAGLVRDVRDWIVEGGEADSRVPMALTARYQGCFDDWAADVLSDALAEWEATR